jgi:ATP phosphoribosyltransferase regulatory subunit
MRLQSKDVPSLKRWLPCLSGEVQAALLALPELYGGVEVLQQARRVLPHSPELLKALDELELAAKQLQPFRAAYRH